MKVSIVDKSSMTFEFASTNKDILYSITLDKNGRPMLKSLDLADGPDATILRIDIENPKFKNIPDIVSEQATDKELPPPEDKKRDKPLRAWTRLTYKLDSSNEAGTRKVESRPNGDIRVSFSDKDDAKVYWEYFREIFYCKNSDCQAVTVSTIYNELKITGVDSVECDKWGWLTLDGGKNRYISEDITKTTNTDMYGFTLKRPIKLYGMNKAS